MSALNIFPAICLLAMQPGPAEPDFGFVSPAVDGRLVEVVADESQPLTAVVFLGTECPMAAVYSGRLQELADDFEGRVRVIGVMSNRQDSVDDIKDYIAATEVRFPIVKDVSNLIANTYGATRTPEAYLLAADLSVIYHGRIDNQYQPGVSREQATRQELRTAIEQTLAGQPVTVSETLFTGCLIGKMKTTATRVTTSLTFCNEISRILQQHCVECHRPGDIGPFALDDYDEVVGWGDTMLEVIDEGRMPPWHADPHVGKFANARHMPQSDINALREWVHGGMPKGEVSDLPPPAEIADGWQLQQQPDNVFAMHSRPFSVPASGTVEYQYFVVDPKFTEDTWVSAAQVLPGNRSVVHHAIVFIRPPDGEQFRGVGWLTAYVPGQRMTTAPKGFARRVPAGSRLVFQMHYTPNGSRQDDLTKVGIIKADPETVTHEIFTLIGIDQEFEIPPNAAAHPVNGVIEGFPSNGQILGYMPHMHFRGRSFTLTAITRDSSRETPLLNVPRYDFNWQHFYHLETPLDLADVRSMAFQATFDNSESNPFNPDPDQWVTWGDQTWEEMAVVFLEVAQKVSPDSIKASSEEDPLVQAEHERERQQKIAKFVNEFFQRLDLDGDGFVLHSEAPMVMRQYESRHFRRFDSNNDLTITRDEVRRIAESRFR